jgi:hypothetical protein
MKQLIHVLMLAAAAANLARAHFVFVVPQAGGASANVFISETLEPDPQVDIGIVSGTKLSLRDLNGKESALSLTKSGGVFTVPLRGSGLRVIHGRADLGISGGDQPYLLIYHPKTILGDAFAAKSVVGGDVPVEIVPVGKAGSLMLKLVARGKPLAGEEVTVIQPDGKEKLVKTDKDGQTETFTQTGRYGAWARFWENTLVFDTAGASQGESSNTNSGGANVFAKLPQPSASFGAVASGGWLYVYGGHVSPTHLYSTAAVSGRFDRMRLTGEPVWEELPGGPPVQGMNLAEYKGKIYRIGGMEPRNKPGSPAENYSITDCARFDPETRKWEPLPALPEARSSHDVVVIGDLMIVAGGWAMNGKAQTWADKMFTMDLAAKTPEWKSAPQPFKRRALMAAAYKGKMYVIGGITDKGDVLRNVSIYDPANQTWSEGPQLPEGTNLGFAPAALVYQNQLYVSILDGSLLRLNNDAWEKVGSATPRVAHRLVSRGNDILVIGGAANGKNLDLIEAVPLK